MNFFLLWKGECCQVETRLLFGNGGVRAAQPLLPLLVPESGVGVSERLLKARPLLGLESPRGEEALHLGLDVDLDR